MFQNKLNLSLVTLHINFIIIIIIISNIKIIPQDFRLYHHHSSLFTYTQIRKKLHRFNNVQFPFTCYLPNAYSSLLIK